MCEYKDKKLRFDNKEYFAIFLIMIAYCVCGYRLSPIYGFCVYVIVTVTTCYVFMKETVVFVIQNITYYLSKVKKDLLGI